MLPPLLASSSPCPRLPGEQGAASVREPSSGLAARQTPYVSPILQMRKPRLWLLAQSHTASEWYCWD